MKVYDRGTHKEAKICKTCGKLFTERKKWKNFDEVRYCSKKCKDLRIISK